MGVDVGSYLLYGVEGEGNDFATDEYEEGYLHTITSEDVDKYKLECVHDGYNGNWTVLGIKIFDNDAKKFAENVLGAEAKFKELAEKYNIDLTTFVPGFIWDEYYC